MWEWFVTGSGGGGVIIAELGVKGMHLFHADVVRSTKLKFVHGCAGEGVEVDVISEWSEFEGEGHTLHYHFLVEVGCAKGDLAEAVNESP